MSLESALKWFISCDCNCQLATVNCSWQLATCRMQRVAATLSISVAVSHFGKLFQWNLSTESHEKWKIGNCLRAWLTGWQGKGQRGDGKGVAAESEWMKLRLFHLLNSKSAARRQAVKEGGSSKWEEGRGRKRLESSLQEEEGKEEE